MFPTRKGRALIKAMQQDAADDVKQLQEAGETIRSLEELAELRLNMLYEASYDVFNGPRRNWGAFSKERQQEWLDYLEEEVRQSEEGADR